MDKKEIIKIINDNGFKIKDDILIEDNENYVTSRIDGSKRKRIYGKYLNKIGITSKQYKILFPNAPLYCKKDLSNTSKKSGLHMKTEKYKKMFSEKYKGELNPNHKSNTSKDQREERSPFNINFYLKNHNLEKSTKLRNDFIKKVSENRTYNSKKEYYSTEEEYKNRQATFSFEKCIKKYGLKKGKEIFTERQIKWHESLKKSMKCGYSKSSQELFDILYSKLNNNNVFYATLNKEYYIKKSSKKGIWKFDFTDLKNKKIIEYNGDLFHANPNIFEKYDNPHPFKKELTSNEIWKKDNLKYKDAKKLGFFILIIWDSDLKKNKNKEIQKCLDFLKK